VAGIARTGDGADAGYRLGRVTALVMPQNTASIRMLSKTTLVDGGVITVLVRPRVTTEARAFSLTRHQYQQYKAARQADARTIAVALHPPPASGDSARTGAGRRSGLICCL